MGRLENIAERNQRPHWSRNPVYRALAIAIAVILVLVMVAFTNLGQPKVAPKPAPSRVDDIQLRSAPR